MERQRQGRAAICERLFSLSGSYLYRRCPINFGRNESAKRSPTGETYTSLPHVNNPPLARSNFAVGSTGEAQRHRSADSAWAVAARASHPSTTTASRAGHTFWLFNGDVNGDNRLTNDILYVPNNASEITVTNGTFDQLDDLPPRRQFHIRVPLVEIRSVTQVDPRGRIRWIFDMR